MSTLRELSSARELLANLVSRELRGKYKRSVLGWSWSLINPLAMTAIFTVVFSVIFKATPPKGDPSGLRAFPLFLLTGLLPWGYLANTMLGGIAALTANASLVKKVYFPREVLVAASTLSWLVSFLLELGVLSVVLLVFGNDVLLWLPVLVVLVALQTAFVLGVGLALSVLNVYFRDIQHFVGIFLQMWFYASPIVYPVSFVQSWVDQHDPAFPVMALYRLNPMVSFLESYHRVLYDLRFPAAGDLAWMTASSLLMLLAGWRIFVRFEPRLAEEL